MAYNRNQIRGKYLRYCYLENVSPFLSESAPLYEFAVEYLNTEDFISAYSQKHDDYCFVQSNECGMQKQKNNARNFCERCRDADPRVFKECKYRTLVENENLVEIELRDEAESQSVSCDLCNRKVYLNPYRMRPARAEIQDVRLRGRPTKLQIRRQRYYCPDCNKFLGKKYLSDIQAYCGGGMTARLAASVLLSQLSAVKREYIAEAYGLSKSQIDRIKSRMIDQAKEARLILIYRNVEEHLNSEVICKVFKDKNGGHVYYAYFLKTKTGEIYLINIITQAERDAAANWDQKPASFIKRFPQSETFYFTCFCILAGEKHIQGQKLKEHLRELTDWYKLLTNPENKHPRGYYYQDTPEGRTEKRILLSYLRRMPLPRIEARGNGSDSVNGRTVSYFMPPTAASSESDTILQSFLSTVASAQQGGNVVSYKELINRLLYFNPAVIRESEVRYLIKGARFNADIHSFYLELNVGTPHPFGAPILCLEHFISNGLLQEDNTRLMPCVLTQNDTENCPNERRVLPCGLSCSNCPHFATE